MTRNTKKKFVGVATFISLCVFGTVFTRAAIYLPSSEEEISNVATYNNIAMAKETSSPYPVRLSIPALNVDAKIKYVGITKEGNMTTPGYFTHVEWNKSVTKPCDNRLAHITV